MMPWFIRNALERRAAETGEQNAQRFVKVVARAARERRVINLYQHASWRDKMSANPDTVGWQWMENAEWRVRVITLLHEAGIVRNYQFVEPDAFDWWTFHALSSATVPKVATLTLEDAL
jgi:hypothetical protein